MIPERQREISRLKYYSERALYRFGSGSSFLIGQLCGEYFPYNYIIEFPKSGGTWLRKLYAYYLDIPSPGPTIFPYGFECVIHSHISYKSRLRRVVYLVRDGRDIMTSFYFHRLRALNTKHEDAAHKYLQKALGDNYDVNDVKSNMPNFIKYEMENPSFTKVPWQEHVRQWWKKPHVVGVKYEDLLEDAAGIISDVASRSFGMKKNLDLALEAAEKFSFKRMTGREQGTEDRDSFVRKGISGDWINHFNQEAKEVFDHYAGDVLVELGYEKDRSWINQTD